MNAQHSALARRLLSLRFFFLAIGVAAFAVAALPQAQAITYSCEILTDCQQGGRDGYCDINVGNGDCICVTTFAAKAHIAAPEVGCDIE